MSHYESTLNPLAPDFQTDTRTVSWADMGTDVSSAVDLEDALDLAGLDFTVVKKDTAFFPDGENPDLTFSMPEFKATVREEDSRLYGVVTDQYEVVQNIEAFDFVNFIPDFSFDRAGETHRGISYLTGHLPKVSILDEPYFPELIFRNSFNRTCGVQVIFVPVRGFCMNQFNLKMMNHGGNAMSMPHRMSIRDKMESAKNVVATLADYLDGLDQLARQTVMIPLTKEQESRAVALLLPFPEEATDRQKDNVQKNRDLLLSIYNNNDDNGNFRGTVWGMINAYTDFVTHRPLRQTKHASENRFMNTTSEPVDVSKILEAVH